MFGTMFRVIVRGTSVSLGVWECPRREPIWCEGERLDRAEVVVPLAGAYVQEGSAGEHFACTAIALLGSPGDEYRVRHPLGGGDRSAVFLLEESGLEDLAGALGCLDGRTNRFRTASVPVGASAFLGVHRLIAGDRPGKADELEVTCRIFDTLDSLLEPASTVPRDTPTVNGVQRKAVLDALEFMADSFGSSLRLADVARAARYSPFHFARLFKSVTGCTVHARLTQLRLRSALHRIREGDDDLTAVALRCGFSSHSHFTASFRSHFGVPPSRVRSLERDERKDD